MYQQIFLKQRFFFNSQFLKLRLRFYIPRNQTKLQCPNFKLNKYVLKNLSKRRCSVVKYLIPFFCPDNVLSHFAPIICRILKRFLVFRFIATDTLAQNYKQKTLKILIVQNYKLTSLKSCSGEITYSTNFKAYPK